MRSRGFTYIELIFTVAILAVMAAVAVPYVELNVTRKNERQLAQSLREIRTAIDAYKMAVDDGKIIVSADSSGYPPNLDILQSGVQNAANPTSGQIYFLRRLPRDPMYPDKSVEASQTWQLRSSSSGPDAPKAGEDVFDIYSTSTEIGLNGVPYNEW